MIQISVVQPPKLPAGVSEELLSSLKPGDWSSVLLLDGGNEGFLQLEAQGPDVVSELASQEAFLRTQNLQFEAKRELARELLQKMAPKEEAHVGE